MMISLNFIIHQMQNQELSRQAKSKQIKQKRQMLRASIRSSISAHSQKSILQHETKLQLSYLSLRNRKISLQSLSSQKFDDQYELKQNIGQGTQSVVYRCIDKNTNKNYAVKIMPASDEQSIQFIKKQFQIIEHLNNQKIINAKKLFIDEYSNKILIIYQYYQSKNLTELLNENQRFCEKQVGQIILSILQGVQYLHSKNICHRDLKTDNILYDRVSKQLKIIDFQNSKQRMNCKEINFMWTNTGDKLYKAPQMFSGSYNELIDIWSIGIIAYQLTTGRYPFYEEYIKDLQMSIIQKEPNYMLANLTQQLTQFIKKCLIKDPKKRINAKQALNLQCIQKYLIQKQLSINIENQSKEIDILKASKNLFNNSISQDLAFFEKQTNKTDTSLVQQFDSLF